MSDHEPTAVVRCSVQSAVAQPATGSSRPRRDASAAAAASIARLARSEAASLQCTAQHGPAPAGSEASSCDVCAAPAAGQQQEVDAAVRGAAVLLGAPPPQRLCASCAGLLRSIDQLRHRLQEAQTLFRRRHAQGAAHKQALLSNGTLSDLRAEGTGAETDKEPDQEDRDAGGPDEQEDRDAGGPDGEREGEALPEDSEASPAVSARRCRLGAKQCATCGRQFRTWRALDGHVNSHTGARPYACAQCERRFSSRPALRQHQGVHSNRYACEMCHKVYSTEPALSTHRSYVHFPERLTTITCPDCGKQFLGQKRYSKHALTHTASAARFLCPEQDCGGSFKTRNALNVHVLKHEGKRFACDQCPALFSSKASLQQHLVRHGAVEAHFTCPHCPRRFIYASLLRGHVASAHSGQRHCVCEVCAAAFTCNSALNAHKLSHQQERPHVCATCGAAFKRKQILERHVRFVHQREVAARCPHCDKGFPTRHKLLVHVRSHTGERPYACAVCQRRFSQRSHVRAHMQMHTAAPPAAPAAAAAEVPMSVTAASVAPPALEAAEVAALLPAVPGDAEPPPPSAVISGQQLHTPAAIEQ